MPVLVDTFFDSTAMRRWKQAGRYRSGAWSSSWQTILQTDPKLRNVRMTVELVFGGDVVIRAATEAMETKSAMTDKTYSYLPLLQEEPEVSSEISVGGSGSASLRSISLTLDARLVKPLELIADGRILAGYGEVSLQVDGGNWDDRIVLLRGDMAGGVSFGNNDELIDFELVDPEMTTDRLIPPLVMSQSSFPNVRDGDVGKRIPLVLTSHPGFPVLMVDHDPATSRSYVVCMASGPPGFDEPIRVTAIYKEGVRTLPGDSSMPFTQRTVQDPVSGRYVIQIDVGSFMGPLPEENDEIYAEVTVDDSPDLLGLITNILTEQSIVGPSGIDYDLLASSQSRIPTGLSPRVVINGSGSGDATRAIEYLETTLSSDFPMLSFAWTGNGYSPVVVDRTRGPYVAELVSGQYPLADRSSNITEAAKTDVINSFSYRYGFNLVEDSFDGIETRDASTSLLCRISEESMGRRDGDVQETATVYDASTAVYIVDWMVEHMALPHYVVEYEGFSVLALTLRLGDNIYISDHKLMWDRVPATVIGLTYKRGRAVVRLCVWLLYKNMIGGARSGQGISGTGSTPVSPPEDPQQPPDQPNQQNPNDPNKANQSSANQSSANQSNQGGPNY